MVFQEKIMYSMAFHVSKAGEGATEIPKLILVSQE